MSRSKWDGQVLADLAVIPLGTQTASVSKEIVQVEKILARFPVKTMLHPNGTNIEGSWDDVSNAIKAIHTELHESGVVRINSNMRWGTRVDKPQTLQDKIDKVNHLMRL